MPCAAAFERFGAVLERRRKRQASSHRLRPEQQRFSGIEVPVLAVALRGKEKRAEPELVVCERVDARGEHDQFFGELFARLVLQDGQSRNRGSTELRSRRLHDGTAPAADVLEVPLQVEPQVSPGRLAELRAPSEFSQTSEGRRCEKTTDGVVSGRFRPATRPVLVGKCAVGGEIVRHPSSDSAREVRSPALPTRRRGVDQRCTAIQLDGFALPARSKQVLPGGEDPQSPLGGEVGGVDSALVEEILERALKPEVRGKHARGRNPNDLPAEGDLHSDASAGTREEDTRESPRLYGTKVIGNAHLDHFVRTRSDPAAQIGNRDGVHPAVTPRRAVSSYAVPGRACWDLSGLQCRSFSEVVRLVRGGESFGMDISIGCRISATNSARPLTPAFA